MKISTSYSSNKKNSLSLSLSLKKDKHVIQQHVLYYGLLRNSRAKKEKKSINSFPPRLVDASSEREVASVSTRPCPRVPPSTSCGPHLSYPPREGAVQNQPASPASLEGKRRKEKEKKKRKTPCTRSTAHPGFPLPPRRWNRHARWAPHGGAGPVNHAFARETSSPAASTTTPL